MKWYKRSVYYGAYLVTGAYLLFILWRSGLSDRVVTSATVVMDPSVHYTTYQALKEFVQEAFFQHDDARFNNEVKKRFCCIKEITIIRKNRTHCAIKCSAHKAVALINGTSVVTQEGLLISSHFYRADLLRTLPRVTVPTVLSDDDLMHLASWVVTLPPYITQHASYTWKNSTEIDLVFHKYPAHPVLITTKTVLSPEDTQALYRLLDHNDIVALDARFNGVFIATQATTQSNYKNKRRGV